MKMGVSVAVRGVMNVLLIMILVSQATINVSFGSSSTGDVVCIGSEKEALLSLKKDLVDPSDRLSSWISQENCCRWDGIVCNNLTAHVEELHLDYGGLQGKLNPSLLGLKHLRYLDLSSNDFGGIQIPNFMGSLVNLTYLDLTGAGFKGVIPAQLGNLSSLTHLGLGLGGWDMDDEAEFYAENLHWLSGLSSLQYLFMSNVNLSKASDHWLQVINRLSSLSELHLSGCELSHIPNSVFSVNFTSLSVLDISRNNFNSLIPEWIFSINSLVNLDLSSNSFVGQLPNSSMGNLRSIFHLDLSANSLEGEIPTSLGSLCNLSNIALGDNKFGGKVSNAFDSLLSGCLSNSLRSLDLSGNLFSGQLTDQIAKFKNLGDLSLGNNKISGPIPVSFGKLSALETLDIGGNQLNGSLPESLGGLSNLRELDISSNHLEGVVTELHFANLTNLMILYASGNLLSLRVSPDWIPPFDYCSIKLESWNLGPTFPMWLKTQTNVDIDISNTQISGTIPNWLSNITIQYLNVSHNQLSGRIPDILHIISPYSMIYMSSNMLSGPLPRITSGLVELDLSNNSFSGDISHFLCHPLATPNNLSILHLGGNHFSGNVPDCWMHWPELEVINLDDNNLTGKIPSSLGSLRRLKSLHLRNNSFSGEIPPSLQTCKQLRVLDLGLNEFSGGIPKWMGTNLLNLTILILRSNKLNDQIPFDLCSLTALQIMDVADNNLSGIIPKCFDNLKAMTTKQVLKEIISYSNFIGYFFEQVMVVTKGREDQYDTILPLVNSLDLSSNKLTGEIPQQLTALQGLISLNLSGNFLRGRIPDSIGNMVWLQSLDLSRNKLSGNIAPSMSSLTYLSYLNLSYNNLSGKIPSSTQLQSLDASCFIGNELCGPPLSNNCDGDQRKPTTEDAGQQEGDGDEDEDEDSWFHLGIATGFVVGFFGIIAPLLFSITWRHAYFEFFGYVWYKILHRYRYI